MTAMDKEEFKAGWEDEPAPEVDAFEARAAAEERALAGKPAAGEVEATPAHTAYAEAMAELEDGS